MRGLLLLIIPVILGICGYWILIRTRFGEKFGERVFGVPIVFLMIGNPFFMDISYGKFVEARDNMRAALIRCGEMLKNGEREVLAQKLSAFVESPEMKRDFFPFTVALRNAVGAEDASPPERTPPEPMTMIVLGSYIAVCLVLIGIWLRMLRRGIKPEKRREYLLLLFVLSLVVMFVVSNQAHVRNEYAVNDARFDVRLLVEAVARPEVPPELLPQLENPEPQAYSYIRLLPPRKSEE